jgi:hypothetical protein
MSLGVRLTEYLDALPAGGFDWQRFNCCTFAAGWVATVEGCNPMEGLPATPDALAARRLIRSMGNDLADAWTRCLGRTPIAPALAQLGDVVLLPVAPERHAAGVCIGRISVFIDEHGAAAFQPTNEASHAWRLQPCAR